VILDVIKQHIKEKFSVIDLYKISISSHDCYYQTPKAEYIQIMILPVFGFMAVCSRVYIKRNNLISVYLDHEDMLLDISDPMSIKQLDQLITNIIYICKNFNTKRRQIKNDVMQIGQYIFNKPLCSFQLSEDDAIISCLDG